MRCARCDGLISGVWHILVHWEKIWSLCEKCYARARRKMAEEENGKGETK